MTIDFERALAEMNKRYEPPVKETIPPPPPDTLAGIEHLCFIVPITATLMFLVACPFVLAWFMF